MIEQLRLEPARRRDAAPIARLSRRLIEDGLEWRWTPRAIDASIRDPESEVVVARSGDRPIGFANMQYRFAEKSAHLVLLAVEPAWRRRGVGRELLDWVERMAALGGIEEIRLEVRRANEAARAFYRRFGYREGGVLPGYYQRREDAVTMSRRLGPS